MFQAKNNPLINRFIANKEKRIILRSPGIQMNVIGENIRDNPINQIKDARMFALILAGCGSFTIHKSSICCE